MSDDAIEPTEGVEQTPEASDAVESPTAVAEPPAGAFVAGDLVLLIDHKKRQYLITLETGGEFHTHSGILMHDLLIGRAEASEFETTRGQRFQAFRPTLEDYILTMPRGAQVIYPKDIAPMMMLADVGPGMQVLETGLGSGALSMALLRAGAEIHGYELREDFASRAKKNVAAFLGEEALERYHVNIGDAYEGVDVVDMDRVILDIPEPWNVVPHARGALRSGGILVAYTPSITQVLELRQALETAGFSAIETIEVLHRGWYFKDRAARPDHRMVAHTAFLTKARLLSV